jgi:hypothetical protein
MNELKIRNWTIPPVAGLSPEEVCVGHVWPFPRLMGDVISHRRIHNRWEKPEPGQAGILEPVDVVTSEIVGVRRILDRSEMHAKHLFEVVTKGGSVYQLEGKPRPSFYEHCRAFGIDWRSSGAISELVAVLLTKMKEYEEHGDRVIEHPEKF